MQITQPQSLLRSGRCSSWRGCLFCYTRSLNPHPWLLLPPVTPLKYSLRSFICYKGATATESFARLLVARAYQGVTLFVTLICSCSAHSFKKQHYTHSSFRHCFLTSIAQHRCIPRQSLRSFRQLAPFRSFTKRSFIYKTNTQKNQKAFAIAAKFRYTSLRYKCRTTNHLFVQSLHSTKHPQSTQSLPSPPEQTKRCATLAETVSIRRAHASRFLLLPPSLHSHRLAVPFKSPYFPFRRLHFKTSFLRHAHDCITYSCKKNSFSTSHYIFI